MSSSSENDDEAQKDSLPSHSLHLPHQNPFPLSYHVSNHQKAKTKTSYCKNFDEEHKDSLTCLTSTFFFRLLVLFLVIGRSRTQTLISNHEDSPTSLSAIFLLPSFVITILFLLFPFSSAPSAIDRERRTFAAISKKLLMRILFCFSLSFFLASSSVSIVDSDCFQRMWKHCLLCYPVFLCLKVKRMRKSRAVLLPPFLLFLLFTFCAFPV